MVTQEQKAAIDKADEMMRPALELYEQRCYLWRLTCRLPLRDIQRLNGLLKVLSDDDLRQIAAYAESLAEFDQMAQSLSGGQENRPSKRKTQEESDSGGRSDAG
jgi:hypothetical protein